MLNSSSRIHLSPSPSVFASLSPHYFLCQPFISCTSCAVRNWLEKFNINAVISHVWLDALRNCQLKRKGFAGDAIKWHAQCQIVFKSHCNGYSNSIIIYNVYMCFSSLANNCECLSNPIILTISILCFDNFHTFCY